MKPSARKVLIVEDNHDGADTLSVLLTMNGHDVRIAYNGPDGVKAAMSFRPDAVILDLGLPGLSGYEVARTLRADLPLCPLIIAVTGFGREEDRKRSLEAGCHVHLLKPVQPEIIEALLMNLKK